MKGTAQLWIALVGIVILAGCNAQPISMGASINRGGSGVMVSATSDFLYSGPGAAYQENRQSLRLFQNKEYAAAARAFKATQTLYPKNTDALYYHALSLIGNNERSAGFKLLQQFRDPKYFHLSAEIRWWSNYLSKKPQLTILEIFRTLRRVRAEAYQESLKTRRGLSLGLP